MTRAQKKKPRPYRETYAMLEGVLDRDDNVQMDDGTWPWWMVKVYPKAGTADSAGARIRAGRIDLPDHEGGSRGVWEARVQRKVKGRAGKDGPAELYVRYVGVEDG